VSVSVN